MKYPIFILTVAFVTALLLASCAPKVLEELSREELFSLQIGKMDNQIDLFQIGGLMVGTKNRIYMRDGLFYVANGNSAKIMELSSYGDLIFLLYNADENPPPTSFNPGESTELAATRRAVAFPLRRIGELVVDSEKHIYVEDGVSEERQVRDKELKVLLDRVILRFDRHGALVDFIGQEGVGGTPFPYIDSLYITDLDELVVICRTPQFWHVYWYSADGVLLYQVDIDQDHLPLYEAGSEPVSTLGRIVPDRTKTFLYLLIYTYLGPTADGQQDSYNTRIHTLSLQTGRYEGFIEVPPNGVRVEKIGTQEVEVPTPSFELLGVNSRGDFFLLRREEANLFQLLILDGEGEEVARRSIVMEDSELFYKEIRLSARGIIYALLGEEHQAKIVWWRSDKLLREGEREGR
ncbi:MAG: hypothetical protein JSV89_21320 [Spirochaetaceae bacterium]|nr:MAG: hypothetical protein JSV89_21320 [Spirochaetaceae bacterium]